PRAYLCDRRTPQLRRQPHSRGTRLLAASGVRPAVSLSHLRYKRMDMSFWDSLRGLVEHGSVAWGFVTAAAIVLVLTPITAWLAPVLGWHLKMDHLSLPIFGSVNLGWASYPITILWIAFLANLVNLIDGMDGLAAGIVAIAAGSFALLAVSFFRTDPAALAAIV